MSNQWESKAQRILSASWPGVAKEEGAATIEPPVELLVEPPVELSVGRMRRHSLRNCPITHAMRRFRRNPSFAYAQQYIMGQNLPEGVHADNAGRYVITIQGQKVYLVDGDYVVRENDAVGRHYPVAAAVFEKLYTLDPE